MSAITKTFPAVGAATSVPPRPSAAVIPHPSAPALAAAAQRAATVDASSARAASRQRAEIARRILAPVLGVIMFIALWALIAQWGSIPGPAKTWTAAIQVF